MKKGQGIIIIIIAIKSRNQCVVELKEKSNLERNYKDHFFFKGDKNRIIPIQKYIESHYNMKITSEIGMENADIMNIL